MSTGENADVLVKGPSLEADDPHRHQIYWKYFNCGL